MSASIAIASESAMPRMLMVSTLPNAPGLRPDRLGGFRSDHSDTDRGTRAGQGRVVRLPVTPETARSGLCNDRGRVHTYFLFVAFIPAARSPATVPAENLSVLFLFVVARRELDVDGGTEDRKTSA